MPGELRGDILAGREASRSYVNVETAEERRARIQRDEPIKKFYKALCAGKKFFQSTDKPADGKDRHIHGSVCSFNFYTSQGFSHADKRRWQENYSGQLPALKKAIAQQNILELSCILGPNFFAKREKTLQRLRANELLWLRSKQRLPLLRIQGEAVSLFFAKDGFPEELTQEITSALKKHIDQAWTKVNEEFLTALILELNIKSPPLVEAIRFELKELIRKEKERSWFFAFSLPKTLYETDREYRELQSRVADCEINQEKFCKHLASLSLSEDREIHWRDLQRDLEGRYLLSKGALAARFAASKDHGLAECGFSHSLFDELEEPPAVLLDQAIYYFNKAETVIEKNKALEIIKKLLNFQARPSPDLEEALDWPVLEALLENWLYEYPSSGAADFSTKVAEELLKYCRKTQSELSGPWYNRVFMDRDLQEKLRKEIQPLTLLLLSSGLVNPLLEQALASRIHATHSKGERAVTESDLYWQLKHLSRFPSNPLVKAVFEPEDIELPSTEQRPPSSARFFAQLSSRLPLGREETSRAADTKSASISHPTGGGK